MKFRIPLIVFVFVILPTVILSMMAGRSLESWELILLERLKQQAGVAIRTAIAGVEPVLRENLTLVSAMMSDSVSRSSRYDKTRAVADKLMESAPLVGQIYLFMNPWGLLYPQEGDGAEGRSSGSLRPGWDYIPKEATGVDTPGIGRRPARIESGGKETHWFSSVAEDGNLLFDRLVSALRKETASSGSRDGVIKFGLDGFCYCFSPLAGRQNLYAGYRVEPSAFSRMLGYLLSGSGTPWFDLVAGGPFSAEYADLIVEDSFSSIRAEAPAQGQVASSAKSGGNETLATGRLPAPFDFIVVNAVVKDPEQVRHAGMMRKRLYMWGILVLAVGVLAGTWLMARESAVEIERARMKGDFLMGVSHDLRTPVASIKMLSDSLHQGRVTDPEKKEKFLAVISRESERLSQLIERVIFFVRMGEDALSFDLRRQDAGEITKKAVENFCARHGQGVEVDLEIEENLPEVDADGDAVGQVILNLLDNAEKYSG